MFYKILFVGLGGFIGAIFRYIFSTFFSDYVQIGWLPNWYFDCQLDWLFWIEFFCILFKRQGMGD